jgi:hypothetical protein
MSEKFNTNKFVSKMRSHKIRNRLVEKDGVVNISPCNIPKQYWRYLRQGYFYSNNQHWYFSDFFTTIIEIKWRWCICFFLSASMVSLSVFTSIYYFSEFCPMQQIICLTITLSFSCCLSRRLSKYEWCQLAALHNEWRFIFEHFFVCLCYFYYNW